MSETGQTLVILVVIRTSLLVDHLLNILISILIIHSSPAANTSETQVVGKTFKDIKVYAIVFQIIVPDWSLISVLQNSVRWTTLIFFLALAYHFSKICPYLRNPISTSETNIPPLTSAIKHPECTKKWTKFSKKADGISDHIYGKNEWIIYGTCRVGSSKSSALYGGVGVKLYIHLIRTAGDDCRFATSAVFP